VSALFWCQPFSGVSTFLVPERFWCQQDDEAFFPLRKFLPHPKQVIDLTLDGDGDNDDDDDDDAIEVS